MFVFSVSRFVRGVIGILRSGKKLRQDRFEGGNITGDFSGIAFWEHMSVKFVSVKPVSVKPVPSNKKEPLSAKFSACTDQFEHNLAWFWGGQWRALWGNILGRWISNCETFKPTFFANLHAYMFGSVEH